MDERENLGVDIYQVLFAGLFIFCLIGAFCLPAAITSIRVLGWFAVVGLFFSPFLLIAANRSRIRNAVEERDGILISKKWIPHSWTADYQRYRSLCRTRYEIEYIDLTGATHRALCNSGSLSGVEWLEDQKVSDGSILSKVE